MSYLTLPLLTTGPILLILLSQYHLLICLLSLEILTLSTTLIMTMFMMTNYLELTSLFTLLTVAGCEASVGLSCLVLMMTKHGHDTSSSLMTLSF